MHEEPHEHNSNFNLEKEQNQDQNFYQSEMRIMKEYTPSTEFGQNKNPEQNINKKFVSKQPYKKLKWNNFCSSQHIIASNNEIVDSANTEKITSNNKCKLILGHFNSLIMPKHCCLLVRDNNCLDTIQKERMIGLLTVSQRKEKIKKFKEKKKQRLWK